MDMQIVGGGVVAVVAVLLWLIYLVPSWASSRKYQATERDAVRLNQALRVLAETTETPEEVRVELNARSALAQQKMARKAEREQVRAQTAELREQVRAARQAPAVRRGRARVRARVLAIVLLAAVAGLAVSGAVQLPHLRSYLWFGGAGAVLILTIVVLRRMAVVAAKARARDAAEVVALRRARPATLEDFADSVKTSWQPRELPPQLAAQSGSHAARMLNGKAAHDVLRRMAMDDAVRERAAQTAPPELDQARVARAAEQQALAAQKADSSFSGMGYVDDAEIQAHVDALIAQRSAAS